MSAVADRTNAKARRAFFNNIPEPTDEDRARVRAEARKYRRACECPDCQRGEKVHLGGHQR